MYSVIAEGETLCLKTSSFLILVILQQQVNLTHSTGSLKRVGVKIESN